MRREALRQSVGRSSIRSSGFRSVGQQQTTSAEQDLRCKPRERQDRSRLTRLGFPSFVPVLPRLAPFVVQTRLEPSWNSSPPPGGQRCWPSSSSTSCWPATTPSSSRSPRATSLPPPRSSRAAIAKRLAHPAARNARRHRAAIPAHRFCTNRRTRRHCRHTRGFTSQTQTFGSCQIRG